MADWSPLRLMLADVDGRVTIPWSDLDTLVGGLPRSAYVHDAFWRGARSGWRGFAAEDVRVRESVTFVRRRIDSERSGATPHAAVEESVSTTADVVLVGCVKRKLDHPAPAQDLYTSALFARERAYAERHGDRWFILSALHGLVEPTQLIEPYEQRLSSMNRSQRNEWGERVLRCLQLELGSLADKTFEIHAGATYADPISGRLRSQGAHVVEPLRGLAIGERLAWYRAEPADPALSRSAPSADVSTLLASLTDQSRRLTPSELVESSRPELRSPGLYSWWVDSAGAGDLTCGLKQEIQPGLIYAGLAGATRTRSGKRSKNTLWGRLTGMHLGSRHEFSTFRLSLGSVLASAAGADEIDEGDLTTWMYAHLRVIPIPVDDPDTLDGLETAVLGALDPPLNLQKMPRSPVRSQLSQLRRRYSNK
jgi:hypothetical protein